MMQMRRIILFLFLISPLLWIPPLSADVISEKVMVGPFQSRAIWTRVLISQNRPAPVVILIPGSGAHGPEEMMPARITEDGAEHPLFSEIAATFHAAGVHTLAVGKPGVEFFSKWDPTIWFYDRPLYEQLQSINLFLSFSPKWQKKR
ncbi:MAG: hypothetical protein HY391_04640 [Deltaproteobacteria bacterium]|nr:hypothetical protein [Deltaproteobacteria bacterium]